MKLWVKFRGIDKAFGFCKNDSMKNISIAVSLSIIILGCGFFAACTTTGRTVASVSLDNAELTLVVGASRSMVATISPAKASNKDVIWVSDETDIATVDENGTVTAIAPGSAVITVTTVDGEKTADCAVTVKFISMVRINGGTFTMGSDAAEVGSFLDERPQHEVTLSDFHIGQYLITQRQWELVMGDNPSEFVGSGLPVEHISWYDALIFCNKLSMRDGLNPAYRIGGSADPATWGPKPTESNARWNAVQIADGANGYRLPTEAQWEYACRAGSTTPFNTGNNITTGQANYDGTSPYNNDPAGEFRQQTTEVGCFAPNAWGLYDMHGNVWEWCWDVHGLYTDAAQQDPQGATSGGSRIARSGSWNNRGQNLRSAARGSSAPSFANQNIGFRVVHP
jgi:formylglycine-generating enzyme required for sulfatase activity